MQATGLRVKICGITKSEQGRSIAQLGANALGFICAPASPRYVSPDQIATIVAALPVSTSGSVSVDRIGVFVNAGLEDICHAVAIGQLTGVQLHGDESPEFCDQLRQHLPAIELIKALRIRTVEALMQANAYTTWVDTLLLDAYDPTLPGGTGKTLDWSTLSQFQPACPWFLAGGLTPDNILDALSQTQPQGIDLSSGVEYSPGNKNLLEVARLFTKLQQVTLPAQVKPKSL